MIEFSNKGKPFKTEEEIKLMSRSLQSNKKQQQEKGANKETSKPLRNYQLKGLVSDFLNKKVELLIMQ